MHAPPPPLHVVRAGPRGGSPIVLVHAVGLDLTYWDRQIEALSGTRDVLAFDLPGHGRSAGGPESWTFDEGTATIARLIDALNAGPAHLVGISFGGMLAQKVVLAHPERVRSLALIATAPTFAEPVRASMRARAEAVRKGGMAAVLESTLQRWFTAETFVRRPDVVDRASKTLLGDDPTVHAAIWDLIADDFDVLGRLGEIRCPTLVLVGDSDPSTPPSVAATLADGIRGARRVVLHATSHMATVESPAAVSAELVRFFSEQ